MCLLQKTMPHSLVAMVAVLLLLFSNVAAQQRGGTLTGLVTDQLGGVVPNVSITITGMSGPERNATSNGEGLYTISDLPAGRYLVRASAPGFALYEKAEVDVADGRRSVLDIKLAVTLKDENVNVAVESTTNTTPEGDAGGLRLRGSDLDALPDDPEDLDAVLRGLAGPSAGPTGGQTIIVDGFTGGRVPSKASIREVRININPFSAEYDQLGFGRIEILTKPGADTLHGQLSYNFNDESLNARNPLARRRAPFQARTYAADISGPIVANRSSFFIDFYRRETDDNAVISATSLDPSLNIVPFQETVLTPKRFTLINPRFDFQLNANNTLIGRYTYAQSSFDNAGLDAFSLPSRTFNGSDRTHTLQLTETAVLNQSVVNETLFQIVQQRRDQQGDNSLPGIGVLDAFFGGGSATGLSFANDRRWELINTTTWAQGTHTVRAGLRLRGVSLTDVSETNFNGTYIFAGGFAPQLNANNEVVRDPSNGNAVLIPITSIERYRRTLIFQRQGLLPAAIRALGGGATQFTIAAGEKETSVSQRDLGAFILDDWRVRPNLTLSLGLRYELQNNIHNRASFAPRVAFAWSPAAGGPAPPKTVVRGGFGIFYQRVEENLTLQTNRFDRTRQQLFVISNPSVLDLFPGAVPAAMLSNFASQTVTRNIAPDLREPYTMQVAISAERQLPLRTTLSVAFIGGRTLHLLRSRNINAPLPGTVNSNDPASGRRPFGNVGDIYQYEGSGRQNLRQLIFSFNNRFSPKFGLFGAYIMSRLNNDTDGPETFPSNSYDLRNEYARSTFDIRHRFFVGGSMRVPWGINLSPLVIFSSSRPFNIITGRDTNNDGLFTERPALATDLNRPGIISTPYGAFDPDPAPGQPLIPRNFGKGPNLFWVILRVGRTFSFGKTPDLKNLPPPPPGLGPPPVGPGGPIGPDKPYKLTLSLQIQNLFNRNNMGTPIGNLSSPLFGLSNTLGGGSFSDRGGSASSSNRRIEAQIRFSF